MSIEKCEKSDFLFFYYMAFKRTKRHKFRRVQEDTSGQGMLLTMGSLSLHYQRNLYPITVKGEITWWAESPLGRTRPALPYAKNTYKMVKV